MFWLDGEEGQSETSDPLSPALNSHPGSTVPKVTRWEAALRRVGRKHPHRETQEHPCSQKALT